MNLDVLEVLSVTRSGSPVNGLNELECVGNDVFANVYGSEEILRVHKATGVITGSIDGSRLTLASGRAADPLAVLNGIAYDPSKDTFYLTGKHWPTAFEIRLTDPKR